MPQMANITVKAANGTTDVVYSQLTPSAGDSVPAKWRAEAVSTIVAHRPRASLLSRDNAKKNGRVLDLRYAYPVQRTINGDLTLIGIIPLELRGTIGDSFTQAEIDEAVMQGLNFAGAVLIRDCFKSGYAAT